MNHINLDVYSLIDVKIHRESKNHKDIYQFINAFKKKKKRKIINIYDLTFYMQQDSSEASKCMGELHRAETTSMPIIRCMINIKYLAQSDNQIHQLQQPHTQLNKLIKHYYDHNMHGNTINLTIANHHHNNYSSLIYFTVTRVSYSTPFKMKVIQHVFIFNENVLQ